MALMAELRTLFEEYVSRPRPPAFESVAYKDDLFDGLVRYLPLGIAKVFVKNDWRPTQQGFLHGSGEPNNCSGRFECCGLSAVVLAIAERDGVDLERKRAIIAQCVRDWLSSEHLDQDQYNRGFMLGWDCKTPLPKSVPMQDRNPLFELGHGDGRMAYFCTAQEIAKRFGDDRFLRGAMGVNLPNSLTHDASTAF